MMGHLSIVGGCLRRPQQLTGLSHRTFLIMSMTEMFQCLAITTMYVLEKAHQGLFEKCRAGSRLKTRLWMPRVERALSVLSQPDEACHTTYVFSCAGLLPASLHGVC